MQYPLTIPFRAWANDACFTAFYSEPMQFIVTTPTNLRRTLSRIKDATIAFAVRHAVSSEKLSRASHLKPHIMLPIMASMYR